MNLYRATIIPGCSQQRRRGFPLLSATSFEPNAERFQSDVQRTGIREVAGRAGRLKLRLCTERGKSRPARHAQTPPTFLIRRTGSGPAAPARMRGARSIRRRCPPLRTAASARLRSASPSLRSVSMGDSMLMAYASLEARINSLTKCTRAAMTTQHHLKALINASNCVRSDLSCGVMGGILRSIPNNS